MWSLLTCFPPRVKSMTLCMYMQYSWFFSRHTFQNIKLALLLGTSIFQRRHGARWICYSVIIIPRVRQTCPCQTEAVTICDIPVLRRHAFAISQISCKVNGIWLSKVFVKYFLRFYAIGYPRFWTHKMK